MGGILVIYRINMVLIIKISRNSYLILMADISFFDQYSLAHFAFGIIVYYVGLTFEQWFWLHLIFELIENGQISREIAHKYIPKFGFESATQDTIINSIGDQIFAMAGWLTGYFVDLLIFKNKPTPIIINVLTEPDLSKWTFK